MLLGSETVGRVGSSSLPDVTDGWINHSTCADAWPAPTASRQEQMRRNESRVVGEVFNLSGRINIQAFQANERDGCGEATHLDGRPATAFAV